MTLKINANLDPDLYRGFSNVKKIVIKNINTCKDLDYLLNSICRLYMCEIIIIAWKQNK